MTKPGKARPIKLECGDERWFNPSHIPEPGSDIWCPKCNKYTRAEVTPRVASIEGDWRWTPLKQQGHYYVQCNRTLPNGQPCQHAFRTSRGWYDAEARMDRHLKLPPHGSGRFTSTLVIERKVYDDDKPPF